MGGGFRYRCGVELRKSRMPWLLRVDRGETKGERNVRWLYLWKDRRAQREGAYSISIVIRNLDTIDLVMCDFWTSSREGFKEEGIIEIINGGV